HLVRTERRPPRARHAADRCRSGSSRVRRAGTAAACLNRPGRLSGRLRLTRPPARPILPVPHRHLQKDRSMDNRHASRIPRSAFTIAIGAALIVPGSAHAQFTDAPAPAAYALQNVTVVRPDGSSDAGQTIVVRAGRIETLARGAAVPADARMLEGDTLYVYPGFIDAAGTVPFAFPRDTTDRSGVRSW